MTNDQQWLTTSAGVKMPWMIYGTAWKKERTADLVVNAVQLGFKGIDTACQPKHYEEPGVGEALVRLEERGIDRESLFLQTKFTSLSGQDPNRVPYDRNSAIESQVLQSFEVSQKNLRTSYVDSFVLHSPVAPHSRLMKVWAAMETIHDSGGARQLGISNCYDLQTMRRLYADAQVKPAVLQNRFFAQTGYDAALRLWCTDQSVIYQSFWTLTANPHILLSRTVREAAVKYGKTEAQILFGYLRQVGIVPLNGTCSQQHMKEDLDVFDFELSSGELLGLNGLFTDVG